MWPRERTRKREQKNKKREHREKSHMPYAWRTTICLLSKQDARAMHYRTNERKNERKIIYILHLRLYFSFSFSTSFCLSFMQSLCQCWWEKQMFVYVFARHYQSAENPSERARVSLVCVEHGTTSRVNCYSFLWYLRLRNICDVDVGFEWLEILRYAKGIY